MTCTQCEAPDTRHRQVRGLPGLLLSLDSVTTDKLAVLACQGCQRYPSDRAAAEAVMRKLTEGA